MTSSTIPAPVAELPANTPSLFVDSTSLLHHPEELRARAIRDGYLFFKQLLPKEPLLELRRQMLTICGERGWLAPGHDLMDGFIDVDALNRIPNDRMRRDIGISEEGYLAVQKLELFHSLPHHPKLIAVYQALFGKEVLPHPRHIARMITAQKDMHPTPPHQDFIHIQGTENVWTCWFPLGDCPREMGGLTVLRSSNQNGVIPIHRALGAGEMSVTLCARENDWVEGDYELGDVLTFSSHTVHKALKSQHPERIRLSCDVRFQPADEPIHEASLLPHLGATWDQLYEGWQNPDVQYYWKKHNLQLSPWNDQIHWQKERICT